MSMAERNIVSAIGLIAFAVWYAWQTSKLPLRDIMPHAPGPSFFPWLIVFAVLALSTALLIQGIRQRHHDKADPSVAEIPIKVLAALACFFVYLVALPYLGFIVSSILFFAALMVFYGSRNPVLIAAASIAIPVILFALFRYAFQVILPRGIFSF